jgi:hypothetical protein
MSILAMTIFIIHRPVKKPQKYLQDSQHAGDTLFSPRLADFARAIEAVAVG